MLDIAKQIQNLPVKESELKKYILIERGKISAQIKLLESAKKLEVPAAMYQAALRDTQDRAEVLLYAEARYGEMLAGLPKKRHKGCGSKGGTSPTLPPGVEKKESHLAQKIARHAEEIPVIVAKARESGTVPLKRHVLHEVDSKKAHVSRNSGENEWYTPKEIIEASRFVMGSIDLDPASSADADRIVKAGKIYTIAEDGLDQTWNGNIWMNPPYSQPLMGRFCRKLIDEYECENVNQAIVLMNNATETQHGQLMLCNCAAVCFHKGRIKFTGPAGGTPLQGQMILYFGSEDHKIEEFIKVFKKYGVCLLENLDP